MNLNAIAAALAKPATRTIPATPRDKRARCSGQIAGHPSAVKLPCGGANPPANPASFGKSIARFAAIFTNCSSVPAASSVSPRLDNWLQPARPTTVSPMRVTTGTPIHSASRLVVWPLYGSVSRQMSMRCNCEDNRDGVGGRRTSIAPRAISSGRKCSSTRCRASPAGAMSRSREFSTRFNTPAQRAQGFHIDLAETRTGTRK